MKTSEVINEILASEHQTVCSFCHQIIGNCSRAIELINQHVLDLLLPVCAELDHETQTLGSNDQAKAIDYLRETLERLTKEDENAYLMIPVILDLAWRRLRKKYSLSQKIELAVITRVNSTFLFTDSNTLLSMSLSGPFGGDTHREFTRALGLAAMIIAAQE
jgi:hypothetical protein